MNRTHGRASRLLADALARGRRRLWHCGSAWSAELLRVYGAAAGDARYDRVRGCAMPTLARLRQSSITRELSEQYRAADLARFIEGMRKHA